MVNDSSEENLGFASDNDHSEMPAGFVHEICTLLDRIEIEDNASLAGQRFDIAEKYGLTVVFGEQTSGQLN